MPLVTLDSKAVYTRGLLERYKARDISHAEKKRLIKAVAENYVHLQNEAERDYFEIIVNRYLLLNPLSLLELAELYNKAETGIGGWEIRKGIVQLSQYLSSA